jgi:hypothetical protein
MKTTTTLFILILTVFALSATGFGCKEKEPETAQEPSITEQELQEPSEEEQLVSLAESYTQIYGTFTEGNYSNLESLSDFMSTEYKEETNAWLETKIGQPSSPTFGIITEVIISKIINFELGYAEVLVVTERMKTNVRTLAEESYYQNCLVKFIKEDNTWKVDKAIFLTNR